MPHKSRTVFHSHTIDRPTQLLFWQVSNIVFCINFSIWCLSNSYFIDILLNNKTKFWVKIFAKSSWSVLTNCYTIIFYHFDPCANTCKECGVPIRSSTNLAHILLIDGFIFRIILRLRTKVESVCFLQNNVRCNLLEQVTVESHNIAFISTINYSNNQRLINNVWLFKQSNYSAFSADLVGDPVVRVKI